MYRSLAAAGRGLGLCHAGMYALDSLRLEAGKLQWGRDVSATESPYEAGLDHLVCAEVCYLLVCGKCVVWCLLTSLPASVPI